MKRDKNEEQRTHVGQVIALEAGEKSRVHLIHRVTRIELVGSRDGFVFLSVTVTVLCLFQLDILLTHSRL